MNRNFSFAFVLIGLYMLMPAVSKSQWVRTEGPIGGTATQIVEDGNILYAAINASSATSGLSGGDVYRSTDLGESWISIGANIPGNVPTSSLGINSKAIYCGMRNALYRRMKSSVVWDSISPDASAEQVTALIVTDTDIIVSVRFSGLFRSRDDGKTWEKLNTIIPFSTIINAIDRLGNTLFVATQGKGIFSSSDNGSTWQVINNKISGDDLYVTTLHHLNGIEFAGTLRGAYFSRDMGNHWDSCRIGLPNEFGPVSFASESADTLTLYANLESMGVYRSTDFGGSWQAMNMGLPQYASTSGLAITSGMIFTCLGKAGIVRAKKSTQIWVNASRGISNTSVFGLRNINISSSGNILFAGTLDDDFGLAWRTSDNGTTWTSIDSVTNIGVIDFESKDGVIFAGTSGGGIYISDDNGIKWKAVSFTIPGASYINSIASTPSAVIAAISGNVGVIRTTDLGKTWTTPLAEASAFITKVFYDSLSHTLYAGSNFGFFISQDDGATWKRPKTTIDSATIYSITRIGHTLLFGTWFGIYRSMDDGITWSQTNAPKVKFSAMCTYRNVVYAASPGNVRISRDNGMSWQIHETGLPASADVASLATDSQYLYAGTAGYGVWKTPLEVSNSVGGVSSSRSKLCTVYSGGKAILRYSLSDPKPVKLTLINMLGETILKLSDEFQSSGEHRFEISDAICSRIPSGLYSARLEYDNVLEYSKVVVVK